MKLLRKKPIFRKFRAHFVSFFQNEFFAEPQNRYLWPAGLVINIIMWIIILIKIGGSNKPIPLHFNAFYGIELVGSGFLFLNIPLVGLVLLVLNFVLAKKIFLFDRFLSAVMAVASITLQVLLFAATAAILILNL